MFTFATVTTTSPLTVTLDGDSVAVPARCYGLSLSVDDRVRVELTPPAAPLVTAVLS